MKKKIISALLLVILVITCVSCFTGCSDSEDNDEGLTKYTVTFMNGDEVYTSQPVVSGGHAKLPDKPKKDGYDFVGWYTSPTPNVKDTVNYDKTLEIDKSYDFDYAKVTEDTTLYAVWKTSDSMAEKMKLGGTVAAIGIAAVFVILLVLIGSIYLTRIILDAKSNMKHKEEKAPETPKVVAPVVAGGISEEVVAVITASVAMMLEENSQENAPQVDFVVRSIKKVR